MTTIWQRTPNGNYYYGDRVVQIDYTNYRGVRETRRIVPELMWFSQATDHHPEPQWLVKALCLERDAYRTFAMSNIHSWQPVGEQDGAVVQGDPEPAQVPLVAATND